MTERPNPLCMVGAGYVGLVTAVCLADAGVDVRLLDIDPKRLALLRKGKAPIHEPLLDDLLTKVLANGTLVLHDDAAAAMRGAAVIMIAVGTPPLGDGRADLMQVRAAVTEAVRNAGPETVIAIKSTVPPGTTASLQSLCRRNGRQVPLTVCPEFLAEGSAVRDFRQPPQVVIGGDDAAACERVAQLFGHLDAPIRITDSTSAELIKYGVNAFLALKISFINEMAQLCEFTGADVSSVADGIGTDERIGRAFLGAGLGFGGSCFPKDVRALDQAASYHGQSFLLLRAAVEVNQQARSRFVAKIQRALNGKLAKRRIAVLGLAFKPGTDDVRQAASIDVIRHLEDLGASVVATDPVAAAQRAAAAAPHRAGRRSLRVRDRSRRCGGGHRVARLRRPRLGPRRLVGAPAAGCRRAQLSERGSARRARLHLHRRGPAHPQAQDGENATARAQEDTQPARGAMTWAPSRVVVTGGAGFLGSHLIDRLLADGAEVVCVDNLITGSRRNVSHVEVHPRFTLLADDITRTWTIDGEVDAILHFASLASPVDYQQYPIATLEVGTLGTMNALRMAEDKGARFLLASTSEVYGDPQVHPQPETYWGNVNPVGPRSMYDEVETRVGGLHDGVPERPRRRRAHRADLQHVWSAHARSRRPRRAPVRHAGARR